MPDSFRAALLVVIMSLLFGVFACGEGRLKSGPRFTDVAIDLADATDTTDVEDAGPPDATDRLDANHLDADHGDTDLPDAIDRSDAGDDTGPVCNDPDADGYGDGEGCIDVDCDETDAEIYPGQTETCNGYDDNCDGVIDEGCRCDYTNTSVGACIGSTRDADGDCGQPADYEVDESSCDGLDNDCDGSTDEGCTTTSCTDDDGVCPSGCARANDNDCPLDCHDPRGWPTEWTDFEDEVLRLTNLERTAGADCGSEGYFSAVPALSADPKLREAARCHSLDMANNNFFSHTGTGQTSAGDRIAATGYSYSYWAENISAGRTSPAVVVNAWMNSDGHCKNIMSANSTELGVGYVYENPDGLNYRHYWTQAFGDPR